MSSPVKDVGLLEEFTQVTPPVEEVSRRGSNASLQRPSSQQSRAASRTAMTPTQHFEMPHRFSRASVHPMVSTGLNLRDAFGPRSNMAPPRTASSPSSPDNISNKSDDKEFEDASGGLVGLPHQAEDKDTLPNTETLLFRDGRRRIDMMLVYEEEDFGVMTEAEMIRRESRKIFQENLEKEGLELELESREMSFDAKTFFLKIHVPWKALTRYAEVMNLKLPTKGLKHVRRKDTSSVQDVACTSFETINQPIFTTTSSSNSLVSARFITLSNKAWEDKGSANPEQKQSPGSRIPRLRYGMETTNEEDDKPRFLFNFRKMFEYNQNRIAKEPAFYTSGSFLEERDDRFIVKDREIFYTATQRSQVVWQVMMRVKYDDSEKVGIRRLLSNKTYIAAFPLHEGRYEADAPSGYVFDRRLLYLEWARLACWYKKQPLWLIKKYFGDKIGLYYAWLGFYTKMLVPASIVGLLCFFYGLCTINSSDNIPSQEICNLSGAGNITLCPLCDKACNYIKLGESCMFSRLTYLFDNPATVFFAIFMSFWATTFLELWKRRQAVIVWEWDLQNTEDDEEPRPEFEASVKTFRINPVTRQKEPYLTTWSRTWRFFATTSMVLFMVVVVMGAVLGTIIYRISLVTVIHGSGEQFFADHAKIFTSVTAAMINLVIIMILTNLYKKLALQLTNLENPRTQTEYEDSYTFKIFVFQFVNFYSSLIYIAFFKGRFFNYPGDKEARKSEFLRIKTDVCDPAGCLSELCIQLAIIMVGKQFFNNFLEILLPKMRNWWRKRTHRSNTKNLDRKYTRWEEDYQLEDGGRMALFEEYLEMVLQYGFVTLFVAAFPLAPLFALINNVGEIRLDAYKMVTQARRPLAERVEDIGAWYGILQGVTYMAVVSNAFVIGYTSDFIPRMVFKYGYSNETDLFGYIDSSLSEFNTSEYGQGMIAVNSREPDSHTCQYRGYRNSFTHPTDKYGLSSQYWHVFAARLAFVVVFEHIVFALTGIMAYAIPDVPGEVKTQIQREKLLEKEAKYEHGMKNKTNEERNDPVSALRENKPSIVGGGWWGRRLSMVADSLNTRHRKLHNSTVWEEP